MTAPGLVGASAPECLAYISPSSAPGCIPTTTMSIELCVSGSIQYTMDYNYNCVCLCFPM